MNTKKIKGLLLIVFLLISFCVPFWKINYGVEPGDTFFSHNQYIFFRQQPSCINVPLFFTIYMGSLLTELADFIGVSSILLTRAVYAGIKVIAAILIYILIGNKVGRFVTVFSIFFAFLLEKSAFNNFYYSGISLYSYTIFLCLLLLGLEKKSIKIIAFSAFLCSFCVFCRASNIVYLISYLLMLPQLNGGDKHFFIKCIKAATMGFLSGLIIIGIIIVKTIGLDAYFQIVENVKASEIDGHGVNFLLRLTFSQYFSGVAMFFCCYIALLPVFIFIKNTWLKKRVFWAIIYIALFAISSVFIWLDPYLLNEIPGKRVMSFIHLFVCMAIFTCSVSCVYFYIRRNVLSLPMYRIILATTIYGLVAHFGSLSSLGLMRNCFCLIMPIFIYACLVIFNDLSNNTNKLLRDIRIPFGTAALASSIALAFCSFVSMTYTVSEFNRPNPEKTIWKYEELNSHSILRGMQLTPSEKYLYAELCQQIKPHIQEETPLLSFSLPYSHALLNMPPFLKWQGGWTWLTSPKSIKQQLLNAEIRPTIIIPHASQVSYAHYEQQIDVVKHYIQNNDYVNVKTSSFDLYVPSKHDKVDE